jgi:hypothetical protein
VKADVPKRKRGRPHGSTKLPRGRSADIVALVEAEIFRSFPHSEPGWSGRRYLPIAALSVKRACEILVSRGPVAGITNADSLRVRYQEAKKRPVVPRASIVWTRKFTCR